MAKLYIIGQVTVVGVQRDNKRESRKQRKGKSAHPLRDNEVNPVRAIDPKTTGENADNRMPGKGGAVRRVLDGSIRQARRANPVKSVGVKLFLIFLCSIVVVVLLLGVISYDKAKNTIKANVSEANRQTIVQTSEKLDIMLNLYEKLALQIFFDPQVQEKLTALRNSATPYDQFVAIDAIEKKLVTQTTSDKMIVGISIIPEDTKFPVMSGGASKLLKEDPRDAEWFKNLQTKVKDYKPVFREDFKNPYYWFPASAAEKGNTSIALMRTLKNTADAANYTVLFELNNTLFEDSFKSVSLGDGSRIQLVSGDGTVVASNVPEEDAQVSKFTFIAGSKTDNASREEKDPKGNSVLAVFNPLQKADWKLAGTVPLKQLVEPAKPILQTTFIAAGAAALLAALLGFWMVRMIARPLARLKDLMIEGAKGDLRVRTEYVSRDEIGQLSASFNEMMGRITELVSQTNETAKDVLETAGELAGASRKTASSAKEIAVATEEIAGGAGSLALEAERGNELTDLITRQMNAVIAANHEMDGAAREVGESSVKGVTQLEELFGKTGRTGEEIQALAVKMDHLKSTASSVMKVLDVMKNITQQTNILSLNATIEAARAGEAGRGFMVVADEIRGLADQSKKSIALVAEITDNIMNEMNATLAVLDNVKPQFESQMSSVKNTSELFVSVQNQMENFIESLGLVTESIGSLSQSQTVLSESMSNVSAVAEQSSATSEEVASLSNEQQSISDQLVALSTKLESVSGQLKDKLSLFKV